jgi:hypothetical protein
MAARARNSPHEKQDQKKAPARSAKGDAYSLLNLDFFPKSKPSLKEFIEKKGPSNDQERAICIIHYLKGSMDIKDVTDTHIYSAYKALRLKVPNIRRALNNALTRYGWVTTSGRTNIQLTRTGENEVEHALPRGKKTQG